MSKEVSVEQWSRSCLKKTYRLLRIQEWNFDDYRSHCILGLHGGNHFQVIMYHTVSSKSYHLIVMSSYQLSYFHLSTQIQLDFPSYHNTGTVESKAQGGFQMKLHRRYTVLLNSLRHYRINSMVGAILLAKAFLCCWCVDPHAIIILVYTTTKKSLTNDHTYLSGILLSMNSSEVMLLLKRERSKRKPAINRTLPGRENEKRNIPGTWTHSTSNQQTHNFTHANRS